MQDQPDPEPDVTSEKGDSVTFEDEPIHRIGAFTGGEHNVGVAWCGYLVNRPNTPQQVGKFTITREFVTCPSCLVFYNPPTDENGRERPDA